MYDIPQDNPNRTPTGPSHLHKLHNNHPLFLITQNYRHKLRIAERLLQTSTSQQSTISHIPVQQPNIDDKYEQIVRPPHTLNFSFKNNHNFSPR